MFESQNYKTTDKKTNKRRAELVQYHNRYIRNQEKDPDNRERQTGSNESEETQIRTKTKTKKEIQRRK